MKEISLRQKLNMQKAQMDLDRASFMPAWQECGDFSLPKKGRFWITDHNKGDRRNHKILDNTATVAVRNFKSGMMAGASSPSRPWFRLSTPDPDLAEFGPVKEWLHLVEKRMYAVFSRSNIYQVFPQVYEDLCVFGTTAYLLEEDFDDVIRVTSLPVGSYMVAADEKGRINTFMREYPMTVAQIVGKFGREDGQTGSADWSNISVHVKNLYDNGNYQAQVYVTHAILPNEEFDPNSANNKKKRFASYYFESGIGTQAQMYVSADLDEKRYLRISGYDRFPVKCPRFSVTGQDVYATAWPVSDAIGDIKQLQKGEGKQLKAIDKMIDPPLVGPSSFQKVKTSLLPGDTTWADEREGMKGLRAIHEVNFRIDAMEGKQEQVRQRIKRALYEDMFQMIASSPDRQRTAREIEEKHQEKFSVLGPMLELLQKDGFEPTIDDTFGYMLAQSQDAFGNFNDNGLIPPPPEELSGIDLKVEYTSVMAESQKLFGISGMDRLVMGVGQLVAALGDPSAGQKIDAEQWIDEYANMLGVPPRVIRTDEVLAAIKQQQAKAQQAAQSAEMMSMGAGAAKDLSQADMEGDNALTQLLSQAQAGQVA